MFKQSRPLPSTLPKSKHPKQFEFVFSLYWNNLYAPLENVRNKLVQKEVKTRVDKFLITLVRTHLSHPSASYTERDDYAYSDSVKYTLMYYSPIKRQQADKKGTHKMSFSLSVWNNINLNPRDIMEDIQDELNLYSCRSVRLKGLIEKNDSKQSEASQTNSKQHFGNRLDDESSDNLSPTHMMR